MINRNYSRKVTEDIKEEMRQMSAQGHSYREIGRHFHLSHTTVRGYVRFKSVTDMNDELAKKLGFEDANDYQMRRIKERRFNSSWQYRKYLKGINGHV